LAARRQALGALLGDAELATATVPRIVRASQGAFRESFVSRMTSPRHHLLHHSPWEGFFVPVDFPEVLEDDELPGGSLGSSVRLREELVRIAAPLGISIEGGVLPRAEMLRVRDAGVTKVGGGLWRIDAECVPLQTWLTLYSAANHSVRYGAALVLD
ncbi:MAG: hypothetical protein ACRELB_22945, partial [Polyangiaceae bacterium]